MNLQSLSTFIIATSLADATIYTKMSSTGRWIGVYNDEVDARERQPYRWIDAENYCKSAFGTALASYHSLEDELEVSQTRFDYSQAAWVGLNDRMSESGGEENGGIRDGWKWIDGSCYNFEINWNNGQPDNAGTNGEDFTYFVGNMDVLNDGRRSLRLNSFICNHMKFEQGGLSDDIGVRSIDDVYELTDDDAEDYCNEFFGSSLATPHVSFVGGTIEFICGEKHCRRRDNAATPAPTGPVPLIEKNDNLDGERPPKQRKNRCKLFGDGCLECDKKRGCQKCDEKNGWNMVKSDDGKVTYCEQNTVPFMISDNNNDNLDVNVVSGSNDAIGNNISYSYSFMVMAFIVGILSSYILYVVFKNVQKYCVKTNEKLVNNTEFQTLL